jgi:hypothetical protein
MPLKLSKRYLFNNGLLLLSMVSLTLFAVFADTGITGGIAIAGLLACAACSFGLLWSAHKYQSTRLSDAGVEQATMQGRAFLAWTDVQEVRMYAGAFILESPKGKVLVYPKAYENPEDVSEYVVTRMRKVLQERGGHVPEQDTRFF